MTPAPQHFRARFWGDQSGVGSVGRAVWGDQSGVGSLGRAGPVTALLQGKAGGSRPLVTRRS